jgi:uncharacterized protein involved in exopolysaccharide biosynthesis/Mrp family chromosome partitioning ATPase
MKKSQPQNSKEAFGVQDVIYILFKHKWKIVILSLLGFTASAAVYLNRKPLYESQAKLLVRYVLNRNTVDPFQSQMNPTGGPGDSIINTEIEILNSEDLAKAVAEAVGVEKLLPLSGGNAKVEDGAGLIRSQLTVAVAPGSNVVHINYSDADPDLSVAVLGELVQQYFIKHLQIHRSANAFELVSKQAEEVRLRLKQTEMELDALRTKSGITTLIEATSALNTQRARTQEDLMVAKAELAEQLAKINAVKGSSGFDDPGNGNKGVDPAPANNQVIEKTPVHVVGEYKSLLDVLEVLQKRDFELRLKFKSGNRLVSLNEAQVRDYEVKRQALVKQYPDLVNETAALDPENKTAQWSLSTENAKLASITARVDVYENHLKEIKSQFNEQYAVGAQIEALERKRQMEDAEYRSLELNLKNAKVDQTLDPSRMPNITMVQQPSKPIKTYDKITQKIVLGLAGAGMALGLGAAFLIELLFDRRIKRPTEIQARLQLPLLLSIPLIRNRDRVDHLLTDESDTLRIGTNGDSKQHLAQKKWTPESAIQKAVSFILPYSETIRDRIIFNFEVNNITHKPKLVAVTGLSDGAGASTIAAGLAKSFSEISGAKVLLVDLSSYHPEESEIFGDTPRQSLNGALQLARNITFKSSRQSLYYASATARRDQAGLTTFSPIHLYELMPQLQESDFDYIIFDMPPIDQTSRTLTMAGLMDKILLVLDAENTSRDALKWGYSELVKGRADVSCIFNKTRSHAPNWLTGDN